MLPHWAAFIHVTKVVGIEVVKAAVAGAVGHLIGQALAPKPEVPRPPQVIASKAAESLLLLEVGPEAPTNVPIKITPKYYEGIR